MSIAYESGWSTHDQARGTIAHRVFAKCLQTMDDNDTNSIPPDLAVAILREVLRQADVDPRDVVQVPLAHVKDLAWVVVKWANDMAFNIAALVDVEQRLKARLHYDHPDGGFVERMFTGQLDALFIEGEDMEHAIVLDWKDTWGLPGPQDLSFDGYFQQRAYAFLVMKNYPTVQQVTLREVYVRFSEPREASVFRSDLPEIEAELAALVENFDRAYQNGKMPWSPQAKSMRRRMREARKKGDRQRYDAIRREYERTVGQWKASPGAHCAYCPRPTACPIVPSVRRAGRITDPESAERVAREAIAADEAASRSKTALRTYVDKNGPVEVQDAKGLKVWAFQPQDKTQRPSKEQIEKAVANARANGTTVDLSKLYRTYTGTRFGLYAARPQTDQADENLLALLEQSVREAERRRAARNA